MPNVTRLDHDVGRSERTTASGKYGLPSPWAANGCPRPEYGFQSGRSPSRR